jgi:hypothetical protein
MGHLSMVFNAKHTPSSQGRTRAAVGECLLGCGLGCLAAGAGLWQFVVIGLLGMTLFLGALTLLFAAGVLIRGPSVPAGRAAVGLVLFAAGVVVLSLTVVQASMLVYDAARWSLSPVGAAPATSLWLIVIIGSLVASLVLGLGLHLRAAWPAWRALCWGLAALSVCPAAGALFLALVPVLALDA